MKKPTLVVMAAGMGSRYGGLKQIDPIDKEGNLIIDFSIYDAKAAGFEKVVFVIKRQIEKEFKQSIGERISRYIEVEYVYQELDKLPKGYSIPEGRVKPWGTAHAILCCKDAVDGPFAIINSDDYYGPNAYKILYNHLTSGEKSDKYGIAMTGYRLYNTLTDNGYVSRGICTVENGKLKKITERTHIEMDGSDAKFTEDGENFIHLSGNSIASMNMFGCNRVFIDELERRFPLFLDEALAENPLKGEFFLPAAIDGMLTDGIASVDVLTTPDKWYGVTYAEDKPAVMKGIKALKEEGLYPDVLWQQVEIEKILTHKVVEIKTIEPTEFEALNAYADEDRITPFTCTPYAVNTRCLLVRCERVAGDEQVPETIADTEQASAVKLWIGSEYVHVPIWCFVTVAIVIIAIAAFIILIKGRRKKIC